MKKYLLVLLLITSIQAFSQLSWQGGTTPEETDAAVLLFDATGTPLENYSGTIYAHTGVTIDDSTQWVNVIGDWGNNSNQPALTLESGNIYSLSMSPSIRDFYSNPTGTITAIDIVLRSDTGSTQTADLNIEVGAFQVTLTSPIDTITYIASGGSLVITAENTGGSASYDLLANGVSIDTQNNTNSYSYNHTNITQNTYYELVTTQGSSSISKEFVVVINPGANTQTMPSGLVDGINYNTGDDTKATLVLNAPLKDFVYVAGSFNDWKPTTADAMKKDGSTGKFWLELTGLTSGAINTYQYWVFETTPITDSPALVKTADPFSTLVLSPFDDPWIPGTSYPNLPVYPADQEREVTVLQTGQTPYNWQVTNFTKPKKEDLVIYEVLIRDFDADRTFQDLIDKLYYFRNLNINAIELMPVMEFEGNESWGYNPSFHMALDKFYGPKNKLKELVDACHQNGIAVILDVVFNHAMGRNPMNRMWMEDDDNDGWGEPSAENPYFNQVATHSYSIGSDFNHSQEITKDYTKRVIKHWIEEFHIDGFRWDLTKGFTQNCTGSESCTNAYQQDRVDILKAYADYSWSIDPTHYVIFEHLGTDNEEQQWANHRIGEDKGVMMWGKMTDPFNQLTMGFASGSNINRMGHLSRGFTDKRLVGYAESHDEERLMYKNLQYGNSTNSSHDVKELDVALSRMSALGAVTLSIPGPKMIWHFGDLGMDNSINTCTDGSVDPNCRLATKPQPQWVENWLGDSDRRQIYDDWARINALKQEEAVFEGTYTIDSGDLTPRIYIWDDGIPSSQLKNVVILANFDVTAQSIVPDFPYNGTWYNMMDNQPINVTSTSAPISLQPGEFRMFGNQPSSAAVTDYELSDLIKMYPNPVSHSFKINIACNQLSLFDTTGKLVKQFDNTVDVNTEFSVEGLKAALYFVKIVTDKGIAIKKLVIK